MGSENLSHKFTAKDPTFKGVSADAEKSSHHSMSHTSGTQPVSATNGSTASSSSTKKHQLKSDSKYGKLFKLHRRQLLHIGTTLDAIESLSQSTNDDRHQLLSSTRDQLDKLNERLENLHSRPSARDHEHFNSLKDDIDRLINELKTYKTNSDDSSSKNTVDYLVGMPLEVSDDENDSGKTLIYF